MEGQQRSLVKPSGHRWLAAVASALVVGCVAGRALASTVTDLVREAHELEAAHEEDRAIRRYTDALVLDPTCAAAYLGLADLRARRGDTREAERVYSVALEHVPALHAALIGRARVRRVLGEAREGDLDLERYLNHEEDLAEMKELAGWYGEEGRAAAQLAVWRRLYATALRVGAEVSVVREARATIRALQILVGLADPVVSPATLTGEPDPVRLGLSAIARRGG
jgi:tetratricopeptide (TPR) repeat protein